MLCETPPEDAEGRAFLEGVVIAADGIMQWAQRYADLAATFMALGGQEEIISRTEHGL